MCQECVNEGRMTKEEWDATAAKIVAAIYPGDAGQVFSAAATRLDETAKRVVEFGRDHRKRMADSLTPEPTPVLTEALTEVMAGELMYGQAPQAIAHALAVMSLRYVDLLDQWADLYVKASLTDQEALDLDAITTAEGRLAAEKAAPPETTYTRTGMYL